MPTKKKFVPTTVKHPIAKAIMKELNGKSVRTVHQDMPPTNAIYEVTLPNEGEELMTTAPSLKFRCATGCGSPANMQD